MRKVSISLVASSAATLLIGAFHSSGVADPAFSGAAPPPHALQEHFCADQEAIFRSRMAFLEAKLDLQPAQRQSWDVFVADSRIADEPMRRLCDERPGAEPQAPLAELERVQRRLETHLQSHVALVGAVRKFVVALGAEQQVTLARALHRPPPPFHLPPPPPPPAR
jgi:hypothetical protein